ncbi:MAG: branched-chain amino acid ABC transporter permease [Oscillospiraceae bacterium]|nr:branched-chain amino acid ABC transporter permease [Oscillospiraceae bacterium]
MVTFLQLLVRSLETSSIYALAAMGIILIFRTSRILNFAQGTIGMFCTYIATFLFWSWGFPVYLAAAGAIVAALLLGALIDVVALRHADGLSPISKQIVSLGILMILLGITPILFGIELLSFPRFIPQGSIEMGGVSLSYNGLLNIMIGLVVAVALFFMLQKSKLGLAIRTTASNEQIAQMLGVPIKNVTMFSWAAAGALGCMAGIMIVPSTTVTLTLMDSVHVFALMACVLGGFQTFHGPVIAAYIIGITRNILLFYVSSVWGEQILFLMIFAFVAIRPHGLVGRATVKKV